MFQVLVFKTNSKQIQNQIKTYFKISPKNLNLSPNMIPQFILFLFGCALAGRDIMASMLPSLQESIKSNDLERLSTLIAEHSNFLEEPSSENYRGILFKFAVGHGQTPVVDLLLQRVNIDLTSNDNEVIRLAAAAGHTDIVQMLLARDEVNPGARNNEAIRFASMRGHTDVVRMLLARPEVNPGANDNEAIRFASFNGHTDTVQLLLSSPEVNPSANDNYAIQTAAYSGHADIVKLLLSRPDVNPGANDNQAIRLATWYGYTDIVRMLLERDEVDPSSDNNEAIRVASVNGHADIARMLLSRPDVNSFANDNEAFRLASYYGHTDIVQMFEQDDRFIAIEFLTNNRVPLTITTFLNLFDSPLKLRTPSYIEKVFAERPNDLVASFFSSFLNIPLEEAKAIHNLKEFDMQLLRIHRELENNQNSLLSQKKLEFLIRYYSATLGLEDHRGRFQDLLVVQLSNLLT